MVLIWIALGFVIGWVVFQRPQWATNLINWIKTKIGMASSA
jgi:hypothetical protein